MKTYTIDASVIVKWCYPLVANEDNTSQALALLHDYQNARCRIMQPNHWLAEVSAVISRKTPELAHEFIILLYSMEIKTTSELGVYHLASSLSAKYNHHLFDTLYHAVALCTANGTFITADEKYIKKSASEGRIMTLSDYPKNMKNQT